MENKQYSNLLTPNRRVVTVHDDDDLLEAFQHVLQNGVLSAPVLEQKTSKYTGFLDTRDIVQYVTHLYTQQHQNHTHNFGLCDILEAAQTLHSKQTKELCTVACLARLHKFTSVKPSQSLLDVIRHMVESKVHRVAVIAEDDPTELLDIISQSSIIQWLWKMKDQLMGVLGKTVHESKIGTRPVTSIISDEPAVKALRLMAEHNISGIAMVERKTDRFVGNTSGSDLKLFLNNPQKYMRTLNIPIMDWLAIVRRAEARPNVRSPTITVRPEATLELVVGRLVATKVHRIFVATDDHGFRPEAVISLTDLVALMYHS